MIWSAQQLANARVIYETAKPYGLEATQAALMAAMDESSLLRYANNGKNTRTDVPQWAKDLAALSMQFPHDAVAGEAWTTADSIGMYQQRLMFKYSSQDINGVAELMDIAASTLIFIRGSFGGSGTTRYFLQSPKDLSLPQRVQWTQGSEFPDGVAYAPFEGPALELINLFGPIQPPIVDPRQNYPAVIRFILARMS